ncbi:YpoC family protein [Paraliobacillus sp. JSM ZJ581]|uniref:YpoC family protein n=1 Tax=Paraliobacillus sp. JSM ZJ581 TaxID=3342118 RepID=UPI0035A84D0D
MEKSDVKELINDWKENQQVIADLFHKRRYQKAKKPMNHYTEQLVQALYALNNKSYHESEGLNTVLATFTYAPFNSQERIPFILQQPEQYHSYIQLNELYKETEKICAKAEILAQRNRRQN